MDKQKQNTNNNASPLGKVFAVIGVLAALATGGSENMDGGAILILVFVLAGIGYAVGQWVELVIIRIIFIASAVIMFLMNAAIRRFIWEIISGIFGG